MKLQEPHLERDARDIDINDIVQGGIYDYLKNVSTWVMTESPAFSGVPQPLKAGGCTPAEEEGTLWSIVVVLRDHLC